MKPIQSHNVASILRPECQIPGGERRVSLLCCPSLLYLGTSRTSVAPHPQRRGSLAGSPLGEARRISKSRLYTIKVLKLHVKQMLEGVVHAVTLQTLNGVECRLGGEYLEVVNETLPSGFGSE